jgi:hypothetical protein
MAERSWLPHILDVPGWVQALASDKQVRKGRIDTEQTTRRQSHGLYRIHGTPMACCWWSPSTFPEAEQTPQGSGRQRPSFSVPRLRRGVHRPAAAALRSGAVGGVAGRAALPRLRCPGICPREWSLA